MAKTETHAPIEMRVAGQAGVYPSLRKPETTDCLEVGLCGMGVSFYAPKGSLQHFHGTEVEVIIRQVKTRPAAH